ncbi:lipopolysaccharide assembly LapA domain-containing protein [Undibacterium arcticum]|uniref:Lipopolysaccharide assembly LapA domain-containing protein n=1 Tax=Undibacterium arcticum TaxID=1762892 RepID=A0ABV7F007_9BURK
MKLISRLLALCLFAVFFIFALKNSQIVELHFLLIPPITSPLALVLLGFFGAGALLGVIAMSPTVFRHRRELTRHKKTINALQKESEAQQQARNQPPQPDSVSNQ